MLVQCGWSEFGAGKTAQTEPGSVDAKANGSIAKLGWVENSIQTNEGTRWYRVYRNADQVTSDSPKKGGSAFEFVKIEGGGHTLPSIQYSLPNNRLFGTMCHDIEGAKLAWEFMKLHNR